MKKKFLLFAFAACVSVTALAQAPQKFNYQGVARNVSGQALANQAMRLRISILDGSATGTAQYVETHSVTTNQLGLYNVAIGGGTVVSGTLNGVTWSTGDKYIQVEADATGGTNYASLGTAQLLSVPYAMYAENSGTPGPAGPAGPAGPTGPQGPAGSGTVSGTQNYLSKFTGTTAVGNSIVYQHTNNMLGVGTATPLAKVDINVPSDSMGLHVYSTYSGQVLNGLILAEYDGTNTGVNGIVGIAAPANSTDGYGTGMLGIGGNVGMRGVGQTTATSPSNQSFGVYGQAFSQGTAIGVYGYAGIATGTTASGTKYGIYGVAANGVTNLAGYFLGNTQIVGSLAKSSGTFKIDHPQDPENKYLYHSFVESPDMMNVYNGNITTDANGVATVTLPTYFESLNKDFRYQLTVIGTFAQAIVGQKVSNNQFVIKTNQPNVEVSWQVTGIRKDAYANAHRVVPEVEKEAENKGKYLNPAEFGKPETLQIGRVEGPGKESVPSLNRK